MIGPLLRVAASTAAARSLRVAAHEVLTHAALTLAAALAVGIGAVFLSFSAFAAIERHLDPAAASAIVGGFWAVLGGSYFVAARRRRN